MPGWENNSRYPLDQIPSQLLYFCVLFSASPSILGPGANGAERLGWRIPGIREKDHQHLRTTLSWNIPVMWHVYSNYIEKVNRCSIIAICITEPCIYILWHLLLDHLPSLPELDDELLDLKTHLREQAWWWLSNDERRGKRLSFWSEALVFIAVNYTSENGKAPIFSEFVQLCQFV